MQKLFADLGHLLAAAATPSAVGAVTFGLLYPLLRPDARIGPGHLAAMGAFLGVGTGFLGTVAFLLRMGRPPYTAIHQRLGERGARHSSTVVFLASVALAIAPCFLVP